ncbi:MAG: cupin-like domain-containing protein [Chitinophagales bacterium]|nr:cupin-like domain-containing protein [Chitinophagales bacterium]
MDKVLRVPKPDAKLFYKEYVNKSKPVIITGMVSEWNGYKEWTIDSFHQKFATKQVGIMRVKKGKSDADTYSDDVNAAVKVDEVVRSVKKGISSAEMVLASSINALYPEVTHDIEIPEYCINRNFFRSRIYLGPKGLVTQLHHDLPENLYAVIRGSKHITLYAPTDRKFLYPQSLFSKHPNFSRFDPDFPDFETFSLARSAKPIEVWLEEGEMLYMPSLWWHHIRNSEDSIAVNFWWSVGWKTAIAWAGAQYKNWFRK